jgi:hypothetical protein
MTISGRQGVWSRTSLVPSGQRRRSLADTVDEFWGRICDALIPFYDMMDAFGSVDLVAW